MKYAQIINSKVFVIVEYDPLPPHAPNIVYVPCGDEVRARWLYDGSVFSEPAPIVIPNKTEVTQAEMIDLMEQSVFAKVYRAAYPPGNSPSDDTALFFFESGKARDLIDLESDRVIGAMDYFITQNYMDAADKTRILAGVPA